MNAKVIRVSYVLQMEIVKNYYGISAKILRILENNFFEKFGFARYNPKNRNLRYTLIKYLPR